MSETKKFNMSLMFLKQCFDIYRENNKKYNIGILSIDDEYKYEYLKIFRFIYSIDTDIVDKINYLSASENFACPVLNFDNESGTDLTLVALCDNGLLIYVYVKNTNKVYCRYITMLDMILILINNEYDVSILNFQEVPDFTNEDKLVFLSMFNKSKNKALSS